MNASNADDKATVLVVDDTPANLALLSCLLNDDYRVRVANNGEKALTIASETHPDLILLDIMMPGMDGYEVCSRLQSNPKTRHIPIIFVSAKSEVEDEKKGLDLGAVDYIAKPFRIAIVKARVRAHIRSKRQTDLFESLAMLDGLTHIPNRRRFDEILEVEWQRSCRDHTSLALLMIDIDFFKPYNDHYGHVMGDACLVQVAEILSRIVSRPSDLAARYGGEEFVAVLPNTDTDGARHVAQKLRSVVDALLIPHAKSSVADHLTISIGYAAAQCSEQISAGMLLNCADHWLYQAKNDGRNLVEGGNCIQENCHE